MTTSKLGTPRRFCVDCFVIIEAESSERAAEKVIYHLCDLSDECGASVNESNEGPNKALERALAAKEAELAAVRRDAERYRWVKRQAHNDKLYFERTGAVTVSQLDTAIDAAIQREGEGRG